MFSILFRLPSFTKERKKYFQVNEHSVKKKEYQKGEIQMRIRMAEWVWNTT